MPLHLVHGFKWPRYNIIAHVLDNGLEAASPDWTMSTRTSEALKANFRLLWPNIMDDLPSLSFLEQYDPTAKLNLDRTGDFAFVVDRAKQCGLTVDFDTLEEIGLQTKGQVPGALGALRDHLVIGSEIRWWVVYHGKEEKNNVAGANEDEIDEEEQDTKGKEKTEF